MFLLLLRMLLMLFLLLLLLFLYILNKFKRIDVSRILQGTLNVNVNVNVTVNVNVNVTNVICCPISIFFLDFLLLPILPALLIVCLRFFFILVNSLTFFFIQY